MSNSAHRFNLQRRISVAVCCLFLPLLVACGKPAAALDGQSSGDEIYARRCAACHGEDGHGKVNIQAPAIAGLDAPYIAEQLRKFRVGHRGKDPTDLAGLRMRPMAVGLSGDADIEAVANFLAFSKKRRMHSVSTVKGDAKRGLELYAPCAACHGFLGEGNPVMKAPALAGTDDWYLETQLMNFRTGIRGSDPGDSTGQVMRPNAEALPDDQAVKDVVAYIQSMPAYD